MAVQTIVLYAPRLYASSTFATNQDPESLSATLSDSMSMTDDERQLALKAIAEAITMAEAWITAGNKALTESTTMTETFAKAVVMHTLTDSFSATDARVIAATKALAEAMLIADTLVTTSGTKAFTESLTFTEQRLLQAVKVLVDTVTIDDLAIDILQDKGFPEFILIKDWIELKLQRANIWETTPAFGFAPSQIHLYGPGVYYGVDYYGANPSVNWLLVEANSATWHGPDSLVFGETLFSEVLYSQASYGAVPAVSWQTPVSTARQAWTNNNGESHN